ncbi:hypothetical protein [Gorillibacterium massiliense]|uniref:hypothetical protein n=1 Tax=Gorillibacterium massiliense TaxID=1280390 RepID=UPI0004B5F3FE|nr:hypothetical protein [Gorillibacterium massiliense]
MDFGYSMKDGFMFILNQQYDTLVINEEKLSECIEYVNRNNINKIMINDYLYKENNLNFLTECPHIQDIGIYNAANLKDFTVLYELPQLESLSISENKVNVDLSAINNLKTLSLTWNSKIINLNQCRNLERLWLTNYRSEMGNLEELSNLHNLETLRIVQSQITSLKGFGNLKKLYKLELGYLRNLIYLDELPVNLTTLEFESCKKIKNYDYISKLEYLEFLKLFKCGEIDSLSFIKRLNALKKISFVDTNILDGDLSPCVGMDYVGFNNKKHYSHKFEELNLSVH